MTWFWILEILDQEFDRFVAVCLDSADARRGQHDHGGFLGGEELVDRDPVR